MNATSSSISQPRARRLALLERLPIDGIDHFGRPISEHLVGTHDFLEQWGSPDDVCLAGLCHAVYGTGTFRTAALSTDSRAWLRDLIGDRAESLVFIFGMADRRRLLLENAAAPCHWIDHRTGEVSELAEETFRQLLEIDVANFLDQVPYLVGDVERVLLDMRGRFEAVTQHLSPGAREAIHRVLD